MPNITAETATGNVEFECGEGRKLVLCIEDNGIDILHRCGGNATGSADGCASNGITLRLGG